ncbi:MAG: DUF962 domain-containing protein, partial [Candidatus Melainabacteria bacterium]|nr:DUF962 domain-containing protein [Candidatus Melainabacteria bacterium]
DATLTGKTVGQAARAIGADPLQYFMELLEEFDEDLRWFACNANQRPMVRQKLMSHPHILPGFSDAGAHSRNLAFYDNALSVLRQAATTEFLPMHKAVARITSEPASWFNLDAGSIRIGGRADMTVLDPLKLKSPIPVVSVVSDSVFNGAPRMVKRDTEGAVHHFLLKHQNPANVAMHCFAFVLMYAIPAVAIANKNIWMLLLMPISQAIGLLGHWLFERSPIDQRDTVFSWRAFASLHMMFISVISGRYGSELARAQINYARKQRALSERVQSECAQDGHAKNERPQNGRVQNEQAQNKSTLVQQV